MAKNITDILFKTSSLKCTKCNSNIGCCDCWTKCKVTGCAWSYEKGTKCRNPEHVKIMEWISVQDKLPTKIGWYKIKTPYGDFEAPYVNNGIGEKVWVLPDTSIITHWKNK